MTQRNISAASQVNQQLVSRFGSVPSVMMTCIEYAFLATAFGPGFMRADVRGFGDTTPDRDEFLGAFSVGAPPSIK